jgi:hypothetical protein
MSKENTKQITGKNDRSDVSEIRRGKEQIGVYSDHCGGEKGTAN